ncbi:MAG: phosphoribosyltransferase family protein, partial [Candidatus Hermodarchaeota archaeon]
PYVEGLMKNRYIWQLKNIPKEKLNPIKPLVKGKNIILIDDSILSGDTLKQIIKMLKEAGAHEIHVRVSCPPIIHNCMLNDSLASKKILIAFEKKVTNYDDFNMEMKKYIGADSLKYQTIEALINAIGLDKNKICLNCIMEYCLVREEPKAKKSNNIQLIN